MKNKNFLKIVWAIVAFSSFSFSGTAFAMKQDVKIIESVKGIPDGLNKNFSLYTCVKSNDYFDNFINRCTPGVSSNKVVSNTPKPYANGPKNLYFTIRYNFDYQIKFNVNANCGMSEDESSYPHYTTPGNSPLSTGPNITNPTLNINFTYQGSDKDTSTFDVDCHYSWLQQYTVDRRRDLSRLRNAIFDLYNLKNYMINR